MGMIIAYWILIAITGLIGLETVVIGGLRLKFGKTFTGWDIFLVVGVPVTMIVGGVAGMLSDSPNLYIRQVGEAQAVTVQRLTYLDGSFGFIGPVRVDTSDGIYFLSAASLVPEQGTVYRVVRTKPWGSTPWVFLCPSLSLAHCWATESFND